MNDKETSGKDREELSADLLTPTKEETQKSLNAFMRQNI
jgi:hypothetical protein